jgi:hypothetical protein
VVRGGTDTRAHVYCCHSSFNGTTEQKTIKGIAAKLGMDVEKT